jgi:hypothetical protein
MRSGLLYAGRSRIFTECGQRAPVVELPKDDSFQLITWATPDPGKRTFTITNQTGASLSFTRGHTHTDLNGGDTIKSIEIPSGIMTSDGTFIGTSSYSVMLKGVFW